MKIKHFFKATHIRTQKKDHSFSMNSEMNFLAKLFGKLKINDDEEMPEETNDAVCPMSPRRYLEGDGQYCGATPLKICNHCLESLKQDNPDQRKTRTQVKFEILMNKKI